VTDAPFRAEQLAKYHRREDFSCGVEVLDRYLKQQANQDLRRDLAVPYVLVEVATGHIAGYYTLSSFGIDPTSLPEGEARRIGRYALIPAIIIGRLARDLRYRGQGIGELLLVDALRRCWVLSKQMGAWAVVVDAKDDAARQFYERYGFLRTIDDADRLFLPLKTIERTLRQRLGDEVLAALVPGVTF